MLQLSLKNSLTLIYKIKEKLSYKRVLYHFTKPNYKKHEKITIRINVYGTLYCVERPV